MSPEYKTENADYVFQFYNIKQGGNYLHFMKNEAVNSNRS